MKADLYLTGKAELDKEGNHAFSVVSGTYDEI